MENFGQAKFKWLKRILKLPNGIPRMNTFARVCCSLESSQLQQVSEWIVHLLSHGGTSDCRLMQTPYVTNYDSADGNGAIHMVSAWQPQPSGLGQCKVDDKSNEITAIPQCAQSARSEWVYHYD
jgi:hypothetical protein